MKDHNMRNRLVLETLESRRTLGPYVGPPSQISTLHCAKHGLG